MRLREFDEKEQLLKANEKLTKYKTAAGADAAAADASGNFARGHKRFKGINAATKKQFDNDAKLSQLKEFAKQGMAEGWSQKYKSSINCSHPKGFSQKAHCAGKQKHNESIEMEMVCEDCGMCQSHGSLNEIAKGAKDANGVTKCWPGKHAEGTKTGKNGGQVRNCVPNESVEEEAKHGLYYNVNKRKAAGTSRPASSPKAPTAQAWKDAAKTAKNENVAEDSLAAMRRLAGVTTPAPAAAPNGPRQYRHMPTAVQPR